MVKLQVGFKDKKLLFGRRGYLNFNRKVIQLCFKTAIFE